MTRPVQPRASPATWPRQLDMLERSDALLILHFRHLDPAHSPALRAYYAEWAERVNRAAASNIPQGLKGKSDVFLDPELANLAFPPIYAVDRPVPVPKSPAQITDYKPTSICSGIISHDSAAVLFKFLRAVIHDMRKNETGRESRTAKETVIAQSGFDPRARGIVWNTRKKFFDDAAIPEGYFRPEDFVTPPECKLNTEFIFRELGEDDPD